MQNKAQIYVIKGQLLLQVITRFATSYCNTIDGVSRHIETNELCATILLFIHYTFSLIFDVCCKLIIV